VLLEIIRTHTEIVFEFFGAYEFKNSNLGGSGDSETKAFIEDLQHAPNVILHGIVRSELLAKELRRMNAFLICYDVSKDQSKGTNYHKVLEYLAYGKPVVSNWISEYDRGKKKGVLMMPEKNECIDSLFKLMVNKIVGIEKDLSEKMKNLAKDSSYSLNLVQILKFYDN
jgi:glycosyltransferase involved in cell wall biosynthesis